MHSQTATAAATAPVSVPHEIKAPEILAVVRVTAAAAMVAPAFTF